MQLLQCLLLSVCFLAFAKALPARQSGKGDQTPPTRDPTSGLGSDEAGQTDEIIDLWGNWDDFLISDAAKPYEVLDVLTINKADQTPPSMDRKTDFPHTKAEQAPPSIKHNNGQQNAKAGQTSPSVNHKNGQLNAKAGRTTQPAKPDDDSKEHLPSREGRGRASIDQKGGELENSLNGDGPNRPSTDSKGYPKAFWDTHGDMLKNYRLDPPEYPFPIEKEDWFNWKVAEACWARWIQERKRIQVVRKIPEWALKHQDQFEAKNCKKEAHFHDSFEYQEILRKRRADNRRDNPVYESSKHDIVLDGVRNRMPQWGQSMENRLQAAIVAVRNAGIKASTPSGGISGGVISQNSPARYIIPQ